MEEILASIRRIISEDDRPAAGKKAEPPKEESSPPGVKAPEPAKPVEEEVLELTEEIASEPQLSPEPEPEPELEPEPDTSDVVIELKDRVTNEEPLPERARSEEGLLSRPAAAATAASFAELAAKVARERDSVPLGIGMRTVEDLVKELMRPMIKEWLDAHLPGLVERLVAQEINRVSGRGQNAA